MVDRRDCSNKTNPNELIGGPADLADTDGLDSEWFESDQPKDLDTVSMKEFEQLCADVFAQEQVVAAAKEVVKQEGAKLEELEGKVVAYLKAMNRKNYASTSGTITIAQKRSWALPKGEDRAAFFSYLKEQGLFENMITVNSNTYNAFLKEQFERAEAEGRVSAFQIPGVGEPSTYEYVQKRKAK